MATTPAMGYADLLDDLISATYPDDAAVEREAREDPPLCTDPVELVATGNTNELRRYVQDKRTAVNRRDPTTGRALLHEACVSGNIDAVKHLLQHPQTDIMLRTMMGRCTPLHLAVTTNHRAIVFMLLSHGADALSRDRFGCSPMHYVKSITVAKLLVQYGGKVLDNNSEKKSALESVEAQDDDGASRKSHEGIRAIAARTELIKFLRTQAELEFKAKLELLRQRRKLQEAGSAHGHKKVRRNGASMARAATKS